MSTWLLIHGPVCLQHKILVTPPWEPWTLVPYPECSRSDTWGFCSGLLEYSGSPEHTHHGGNPGPLRSRVGEAKGSGVQPSSHPWTGTRYVNEVVSDPSNVLWYQVIMSEWPQWTSRRREALPSWVLSPFLSYTIKSYSKMPSVLSH